MYFSDWRTRQNLKESDNFFTVSADQISKKQFLVIVDEFLNFSKKDLKLKSKPKIKFVENPKFAQKVGAFGQIQHGTNQITIDILNRHPMDILRTLAHELVHLSQHEHKIVGNSDAGSKTENQANAIAGKLLRKFAESHSKLFNLPSVK